MKPFLIAWAVFYLLVAFVAWDIFWFQPWKMKDMDRFMTLFGFFVASISVAFIGQDIRND